MSCLQPYYPDTIEPNVLAGIQNSATETFLLDTPSTGCNPGNFLPELFKTDEQRPSVFELALGVRFGNEDLELCFLFKERLEHHGRIIHDGWGGGNRRLDRDRRGRGGPFMALRLEFGQ